MHTPPRSVLDRLDDRTLIIVVAHGRNPDAVLVQPIDQVPWMPYAVADEGVQVKINRRIGCQRGLDNKWRRDIDHGNGTPVNIPPDCELRINSPV
jgi:hypothetical protein